MKNAMQLKAFIKNIANDKGIIPQAVLQNYIIEATAKKRESKAYYIMQKLRLKL
ncbi:MAG: hypothetical protein ACYDIA_04870 [Candidatus Humimicrobiaceae bacterium]